MSKEEMAEICWRLAVRCNEIADDYVKLASRYDDAMKRINDMQAELEYLRREVNRG